MILVAVLRHIPEWASPQGGFAVDRMVESMIGRLGRIPGQQHDRKVMITPRSHGKREKVVKP
jgi:hypothetical protein